MAKIVAEFDVTGWSAEAIDALTLDVLDVAEPIEAVHPKAQVEVTFKP